MKRVNLLFTALRAPFDYLTLIAAAATAYAIRFSSYAVDIRPVAFDLDFDQFMRVVIPVAAIWIVIFALSGLYRNRPERLANEMLRIIIAGAAGAAFVLGVIFFSRELFDSRFIFLASWALATLFILIERYVIRRAQRRLRAWGIGSNNVVLIGKTKSSQNIAKFFKRYPKLGYHVTGHFAKFTHQTSKNILSLRKQDKVDIILVADPDISKKSLQEIKTFTDIEHLSFSYTGGVFPTAAVKPILHTFAGEPVIEVPKTPLDGWGAIYKRIFDIIGSLILIILSFPIQVVVAIILLFENEGGILFRQKRVGQSGYPFGYFKFRSMRKDAHKYRFDSAFLKKHGNMRGNTPLFKLEDDPRVTKFGKWMRKLSIDEVPEFYLVLFGHMSLVGPRPHLPEEVANYRPEQRHVLTVKPGITGMAQVSGRASLAFDEEVNLDIFYLENWSPWLDFIILLKTPIVVIFGRGAY
jgi:exopolysaccharide biosynthesis polyprenyl glycosylphosphotransferase